MNQGFIGWSGVAPGGGLTLLRKVVLQSAESSVLFDIPSGYSGLRFMTKLRGDTAANFTEFLGRFNGDGAANYNRQLSFSSNATNQSTRDATVLGAWFGYFPAATGLANAAGIAVVDIPNYSDPYFYKFWLGHGVGVFGNVASTLENDTFGGYWANTAPLTSITFVPAAGKFILGSSFALYGYL